MTSSRTPTGWFAGALASVLGLVAWFGLASPTGAQTTGSDSGEVASSEGEIDRSEESLRERLERLLSGYHFVPDREALDGLASEDKIAKTLRSIASDKTARPSLRSRAIEVLALYPSEQTEAFLKAYLEAPDDDLSEKQRRAYDVVRLHAIASLAELQERDEAVESLEPLLDADDLQVRLMAVEALGEHGGEAGERRLREFAEETDEREIRREIENFVDLE